jgi:hypothetical protein
MLGCQQSVVMPAFSPMRFSPIAWYRADVSWINLGALADVELMLNAADPSTPVGLDIGGTDPPQFLPAGWSGNHGALSLDRAVGKPMINDGTLGTFGTGTDLPVSVIATGTITDGNVDHTFCVWDDTVGNSLMKMTTDTGDSDGRMLCTRTDAAGSSASAVGTRKIIANTRRRMAWVFQGTSMSIYMDGELDTSAALDVGACNFTRFRLFSGPVVDSWGGLFREVIVVPRPLSAAEVRAHYLWSLANEGP